MEMMSSISFLTRRDKQSLQEKIKRRIVSLADGPASFIYRIYKWNCALGKWTHGPCVPTILTNDEIFGRYGGNW